MPCIEEKFDLDASERCRSKLRRRGVFRWLGGVTLGTAAVLSGCSSVQPTRRGVSLGQTAKETVASSWEEYRVRAALQIVEANPEITYMGPVQEPLLAIPVLEIEVDSTGRVRKIDVKRVPSQATDTVQLAIEAVNRAAPFGEVRHLPKPWKFTEVFLFDDERRFKPQVLDQ